MTWRPKPCKHGAQPLIEVEQVPALGSGTFARTVPGRADYSYDCPTPIDCRLQAHYQWLASRP